MKITVDSQELKSAINEVRGITGADHATLKASKKGIYVMSSANNRSIKILLSGEVDGKGSFGFNVHTLSRLCSGRQSLTLEYNDISTVTVHTSGTGFKFRGEFQTIAAEDIEVIHETSSKVIAIESKTLATVVSSTSHVSLNNLLNKEPMMLCVSLNKEGLRMGVFDQFHIAVMHDPSIIQKKDPVEFILPLDAWNTVVGVASGQKFELRLSMAYLTVVGETFEMSIPIMQSKQMRSLSDAQRVISAIPDLGHHMVISKSELQTLIDILTSVDDANSSIQMTSTKRGKVTFKLQSSFGKMEEIRDVEGGDWTVVQGKDKKDKKGKKDKKSKGSESYEYKVNPAMFLDCIAPVPTKELKMSFAKQFGIIQSDVGNARYTYVINLLG